MKLIRDKVLRETYMVSKLCGMIARGDLRDDHPQQRKSGQWSAETRDNFIVTVIENLDFDPIKICEQLTDKGVVLWLIDGLQRSTTIENFKAGRFALGRKIDPAVIEYQEAVLDDNGKLVRDEDGNIMYNNIQYDLRGKSYADLPEKLKEDFNNCPINIVKHLDCSDKEVGRHIIRYNSGVAMKPAQKISAYMYNVAKYVKNLSAHDFFNDCVNLSESCDRNGTVDKMVSEAVMGLNFFESHWVKDAQKMGTFLNENATKDMFDNFESYLDRLMKVVVGDCGMLFSPKNALLWFMTFDKFTKLNLSDERFGEFLLAFVNELHSVEVNGTSFDSIDAERSTKDKGIIELKLSILESLMNEFLGIDATVVNDVEVVEVTSEDVVDEVEEDFMNIDEDFVKQFSDTDLMYTANLSDSDTRSTSLGVLNLFDDKEDALFYADCANEWLLKMENVKEVTNKYVLPAIVKFVKYIYDMNLENEDDYGVDVINKFVHSGAVSNNIQKNYMGLVAFAA